MRACRSSEADGSVVVPRRTSEPLAAFPRSPQRNYGDFEGVIFARWLQQSLDLRSPR
jgi:hypothetical protein